MLNRAISLLENSKIQPVIGYTVRRENGVVMADSLGAIALGSRRYYVTRSGKLARKAKMSDSNRGGTTNFSLDQILVDVGVDERYARKIASKLVRWSDSGESFQRQASLLKWRK